METRTPYEDRSVGPMIALRPLLARIWRKRRVWLMTALLGLIVGTSLRVVIPSKDSAVTDLYLAQLVGANPSTAMADDVALLKTEVVAKEAVSSGHLHDSPIALTSHYSGLPLSDTILAIKFTGSSPGEALSGAKAVAQAFLSLQARELRLQTDVLVRGLQSQTRSLDAQISELDAQINSLSSAAPTTQTGDQLTDLVDQRDAAATQASQLQVQTEQARLNEQSVDQGSHVLDPAAIVPVSVKKMTFMDALSGLIVGLAVGLAAVIFSSILRQSAPDRSTVAATLGAPVELSLGPYHRPRVMRKRRLSRQIYEPSPALQMVNRRLRGHLESAPGSALAVVTAGAAEPAALAGASLALTLSSEGHGVVIVDAAENRDLAWVLGLTTKTQAVETFQVPGVGGPGVRVIVAPEDPAQMAQKTPPDDADAVLVLATLDPAFGADHLASWVTDAVMILSPQKVSLTRLSITREMLRNAGISLRCVILLGSDPEDNSSGALGRVDLRLTPVESPEFSQ